MPPQEPPPRARNARLVTEPLDPPMVPFALAGTAIWAVVGMVLLVAGAPAGWLWTCLAGFGFGLLLVVVMVLRDRRRRRRQPADGPS